MPMDIENSEFEYLVLPYLVAGFSFLALSEFRRREEDR